MLPITFCQTNNALPPGPWHPAQGDTTLQQLCVMCMTQNPTERPSFTTILDCMDKAYHSSGAGSSHAADGQCAGGRPHPQPPHMQPPPQGYPRQPPLLIEAAEAAEGGSDAAAPKVAQVAPLEPPPAHAAGDRSPPPAGPRVVSASGEEGGRAGVGSSTDAEASIKAQGCSQEAGGSSGAAQSSKARPGEGSASPPPAKSRRLTEDASPQGGGRGQ